MNARTNRIFVGSAVGASLLAFAASLVATPGSVASARAADETSRPLIVVAPAPQRLVDPADPLAEDRKLRRSFGLDDSDQAILLARKLLEAGSPEVTDELGAPIYTSDLAEIKTRYDVAVATREALDRIEPLLPARALAGTYTDHGTGRLVVMVTPTADGVRDLILAALPSPDRVDLRAVTYTLDELDSWADQVILSETLRAAGVQIVESTSDHLTNTVNVTIDGDLENASKVLSEEFPDVPLTLVPALNRGTDEGTQAPSAPPWRGGMAVTNRQAGGTCTTGFVAKDGEGAEANYFVLTAGHCGLAQHEFDSGVAGNTSPTQRPVAQSAYNARADALSFTIGDNARNQFVRFPGVFGNVQQWERRTQDGIGDPVCVSRMTTENVSCGEITGLSSNSTRTSFGRTATFLRLRSATYTATGGDSGGSTYWFRDNDNPGYLAKGLHKGNNDSGNREVYTQIEDGLDELGIDRIAVAPIN